MVTTDSGVNRIRDLFKDDIYKCQAGTGTTSPTAEDTSLETADSNTLLAPTTSTSDKAVQVTHTISSAIGSGNDYSEQETQIESGSTMMNRIVHDPLTKGGKDQYNYITTFFFESA